MKRLSKEDQQFINRALIYTDADKEAIKKIKYLNGFFGNSFSITDDEKKRFSTLDGIQEQINSFENPVGLIYYYKVTDGKVGLEKKSIIIPKDKFYEKLDNGDVLVNGVLWNKDENGVLQKANLEG